MHGACMRAAYIYILYGRTHAELQTRRHTKCPGLLGRFTKSGHFLPKKRKADNSKTASPMPPDQRKKLEDYTNRITPQALPRP